MFMPLKGEVLEFNAELESNPEIVNKDPYGEGWVVKIKIADVSDLNGLLDAEAYKELIEA